MRESKYYPWLVVAMTVINQAVVSGITLYCFAIFSIPWLEQFDISRGQLMLAMTSMMIANGLLAPLVGSRLDNISLLWPIIAGYALFCGGLAVISVSNNYWLIVAVYATLLPIANLLCGIFVSLILVNRWFKKDSGLAIGISTTGTSIGGILFPLLVASALSSYSLSEVIQGLAIFFAVVLIPLNYAILRVEPPVEEPDQPNNAGQDASQGVWTTSMILKSRAFWIPSIILLSVATAFVAIQSNLGTHVEDLNYPASLTSQMIATLSAMMIVGKILYGQLSNRINHAYLLFLMGAATIASIILLMFTAEKASLLIAAAILGLASGGLAPLQSVVFAARFGLKSFGKVLGLLMLVMVLGSLGSIYAAWIFDLTQSYQFAFGSFIVMILAAIVLLKWLPPPLSAAKGSDAS